MASASLIPSKGVSTIPSPANTQWSVRPREPAADADAELSDRRTLSTFPLTGGGRHAKFMYMKSILIDVAVEAVLQVQDDLVLVPALLLRAPVGRSFC